MSDPAPQVLPEQLDLPVFHKRNVEQAIRTRQAIDPAFGELTGQESDWHDFKEFAGEGVDKLNKDLVALANTPGGPYQGYGYLIIGVNDAGRVVGLNGKDAEKTVDQRTNDLSQTIKKNITPYIDIEILDLEIDGHRIHIVVVPQAQGGWHMQVGDKDGGFWIRRGRRSDRPTIQEFQAHELRLVERAVKPLADRLSSMDGRLTEQRLLLNDLRQDRSPESASAAQIARRGFETPDRQVLRQVRLEIAAFRQAHFDIYNEADRLQPDGLLSQPERRTPAQLAKLEEVLTRMEAASQPLIEAAVTVFHDAGPTGWLQQAVREIADILLETSMFPLKLPPLLFALRVYPALLLLYGMATVAMLRQDLTLFGLVLHHTREVSQFNGTRGVSHKQSLAALLTWTGMFDQLVGLVESGVPDHPGIMRVQRRLDQGDMLGSLLPVVGRSRLFSQGEALLNLSYVAAARNFGAGQPPGLDAEWRRYFEADTILRGALLRLGSDAQPVLRGTSLEVVAAGFDAFPATRGQMLSVTATGLLGTLSGLQTRS